jgi:hypothetical protein
MAGETPRTNHPKIIIIQLTTVSKTSSQIAVPTASTRCQQSLERVSGLFLEKK